MLLRRYEKRMRIVLDTVVFVRSLIKPNNACGRTIFLHGKKYRLVVSKPLLVELFEVLKRPEIHSKFASSVSIDYKQLLDFLSQAEVVEIGDIPNISRDIKDNKFLETAIAARADYLVSEDKDLLILGKYRGTQILTCRGFADILESQGR